MEQIRISNSELLELIKNNKIKQWVQENKDNQKYEDLKWEYGGGLEILYWSCLEEEIYISICLMDNKIFYRTCLSSDDSFDVFTSFKDAFEDFKKEVRRFSSLSTEQLDKLLILN